jgi:hypothetical protein
MTLIRVRRRTHSRLCLCMSRRIVTWDGAALINLDTAIILSFILHGGVQNVRLGSAVSELAVSDAASQS